LSRYRGDFLAGATAPLALLWLVIGYFQHGDELRINTIVLEAQQKELQLQVKETATLAKSSERQAMAAEMLAQITKPEHESVGLATLRQTRSQSEHFAVLHSCYRLVVPRVQCLLLTETHCWPALFGSNDTATTDSPNSYLGGHFAEREKTLSKTLRCPMPRPFFFGSAAWSP